MPHDAKGRKRYIQLVEAGVEILAESGWDGLTHRAVAARAQTNPGLVHYYFKATAGLRHAVAAQAVGHSITALFDELLTCDGSAPLDGLGRVLREARDDRGTGRITTELISAAFDDAEIGALIREEFARGRTRVEQWLHERHPSWTPGRTRGAAAMLVAGIDGLVLHLLLDASLPIDDIESAMRDLWHTIDNGAET